MSLQDSISEDHSDRTADGHGTPCDESGILSQAHKTRTRFDMMKSWIKACDERHGSQCLIAKADASIWPMWIIDVVDECIVEGDIADCYLTLSYVWGGVQTLQATTTNIQRLGQPGSLARANVVLPKTIRQAIDVTRLLGERYIWIDQLSILQDDYKNNHTQIKHMAEIYANSYLTLVATTGGTADFGLVDDVDQMLNETPLKTRSELKTAVFKDYDSMWNRRGWTFQERVFARRILFFFDLNPAGSGRISSSPRCILWECRQIRWANAPLDATTPESRRSRYKTIANRRLSITHLARWPDFSRYTELCISYSRRNFTSGSDVVIAFSGTATLLANSFSGGILYGLPILFFDIALLWNFCRGSSIRTWHATDDESNRPPSWSWLSWRGELNGYDCNPPIQGIMTYKSKLSTFAITPFVQWYFTGEGGTQIAIMNEYHKYKHLAQDGGGTLPPGWSRAEPSSDSSGTHGENVYVTSNASGVKFRFPIPFVDRSCSEIMMPMPISNRITCRTERAYFYLFKPESKMTRHVLRILDVEGSFLGVMSTPGDWRKPFLESKMRIELIAISAGSAAEHDAWNMFVIPAGDRRLFGIYEFYNVLWIEWTDGVAYRKSVGHVFKEAREAADREVIDVVLG